MQRHNLLGNGPIAPFFPENDSSPLIWLQVELDTLGQVQFCTVVDGVGLPVKMIVALKKLVQWRIKVVLTGMQMAMELMMIKTSAQL